MRHRVLPHAVLVSMIIVTGIAAIAGNVVADNLPDSLQPYHYLALPIFLVCLVLEIALSVLQLWFTHDAATEKKKPSRSIDMTNDLDYRIMRVLKLYTKNHIGAPKMLLGDLVQQVGSTREDGIFTIRSLEEKNWVSVALSENGEIGLVWLTSQGLKAAQEL